LSFWEIRLRGHGVKESDNYCPARKLYLAMK